MSGMSAKETLLELKGLDFRSEPASCDCGWSGEAGQLRFPPAEALQDQVFFACPRCETAIAVHPGLSNSEVQQELMRIRGEFDEEFRGMLQEEREQKQQFVGPSFEEVRARIHSLD
jgi:hypothetical protein